MRSCSGLSPRDAQRRASRRGGRPPRRFGRWRRTSRINRAELFDNLAQLIKRDTDDLAELMARECGKVVTECRAEVVEGLHMVQYVFGTGRHADRRRASPRRSPRRTPYVRRKPWGVVAVITPWNFPFAVPLWMLGPSLLEGNTAVFKPSEDTPAIGQRLVELFVEAGFPAGTINLVHGDGGGRRGAGAAPRRQRRAASPAATRSATHIQQLSAEFATAIVRLRDGQQEAPSSSARTRDLDLAVNAALLSALQDDAASAACRRAGSSCTRS